MKRFGSDTAAVISAYNAGPGNAHRDANGHFPNQRYVDAVLGFWNKYKVAVVAVLPLLVAVVLWFIVRRGRGGAIA